MREIKFRAWDELNQKMVYQSTSIKFSFFNTLDGLPFTECTDDEDFYLYEHKSLMQFTGLFDKNSKEIYEGDIVQQFSDDDPYFRYVVLFKNGAFGYQPHGEDYDFIPYAGNPHFKWNKNMSDKLEIIGNVYETPELIPKDAQVSIAIV